jgi:hypothetical protein
MLQLLNLDQESNYSNNGKKLIKFHMPLSKKMTEDSMFGVLTTTGFKLKTKRKKTPSKSE